MSEHEKRRYTIEERKKERLEAFEILFERMFRTDSLEDSYNDAEEARGIKVGDYTRELVEGANSHAEEIDGLIKKNLRGNWKMSRISKVALTALRISVYELLYSEDVPVKVSINEAVEFAKKYAEQKDGSFVNGVLGSIEKSLRENVKKNSGDE